MTAAEGREIPREGIGEPIEELLRYEKQIGHYEHASYDLLSTVTREEQEESAWRQFLLEGENFSAVVGHILALSRGEHANPRDVLESTRHLVESSNNRNPNGAFSLLNAYLKHRPRLPVDVRDRMDGLVRAGKRNLPLRVIAFASELERPSRQDSLDGALHDIFDHWYRQILRGRISANQARKIPGLVATARERLLAHLREVRPNNTLDDRAICQRYASVFKSQDIYGALDMVIGAHRFGLGAEIEQLVPFIENLSRDEALRRFERLGEWMAGAADKRGVGVTLTLAMANFLVGDADFESLLAELDRLAVETHNGRFDARNQVQRDMEFGLFAYQHTLLHATTRTLPYLDTSFAEKYRLFGELGELPPASEEDFSLSDEHIAEAKRAGFEAAALLKFLKEFRSSTSRPIVVVGNDRYGRQWAVEPIADLLGDGFSVRYDRVPSHMSIRLAVPSARSLEGGTELVGPWSSNAFPREFVRELSEHMPHVVIVDGKSPGQKHSFMRLTRAQRSYANWFVAFNDVRAQGDVSRYQHESSLPLDHIHELTRWLQFVALRRQLREWITPGPTYTVALWTPEPTEFAKLGEITVPNRPPDLDSDEPQVVLANPIVYRNEGDDLPEALRGTRPYYFDGPEKYVKEEIVVGFGPYGFEPRIEGHMTATFVGAVQRRITEEVKKLLDGE